MRRKKKREVSEKGVKFLASTGLTQLVRLEGGALRRRRVVAQLSHRPELAGGPLRAGRLQAHSREILRLRKGNITKESLDRWTWRISGDDTDGVRLLPETDVSGRPHRPLFWAREGDVAVGA